MDCLKTLFGGNKRTGSAAKTSRMKRIHGAIMELATQGEPPASEASGMPWETFGAPLGGFWRRLALGTVWEALDYLASQKA